MIYLDNASTTKPSKEVIQFLSENLENMYFNPSSLHESGLKVKNNINYAKDEILSLLNANGNFIFTSGGTESNNIAIFGVAKQKSHIITSKLEHPSVIRVIENLKSKNCKIDYVDLDENGDICLQSLKSLIKEDTELVSIMHINNETGTINDIKEIGKIVKLNSKALFHVDAVSSFGKHNIDMSYIDLLSVSSHKIHGPQGVGGLFIKKGVNIKPIFFGGHQQNSIRPGTEFSVGYLAFVFAAKSSYNDMESNLNYVAKLKENLKNIEIQDISINETKNSSPYILNISFFDTKGQVIVNSLSFKNILTSTGAACNDRSFNLLKNLGYSKKIYESAVRFSFSKYNTLEEIKEVKTNLIKIVDMIRHKKI
ncbi:MAG: cysteine desulfurase [Defluviitaleaceae bacterium]|nr:cysteine desulfurase [Defluviitaleaceae bacterium]